MPFHVDVRESGRAAVLDLSGDLNATADSGLTGAYAQVTTSGTGPIILNFADVGYMNSTGIAIIVGILGRAHREGRDVRAVGLSDHYRHIFEITRLADFMHVYEDEAAAVIGAAPATA